MMKQESLQDHADMLQYYLRVISRSRMNHYKLYSDNIMHHLHELAFAMSNNI